MGVMNIAKGAVMNRKAFRTYTKAMEAGGKDQPEEAKALYQTALKEYGEAVELGFRAPNTLLSYALLLMREGEFEKAKEYMLEINRQPKLPDDNRFQLRVNYSVYLWKTGRLDEAIATIRRAADMKMNGTIFSMLGMYLMEKARQTGDFDEALAFNRQAMDYDDEDGEVLDNMAQLCESMSEYAGNRGEEEQAAEYRDQAKGYYEKAHAARPRQITSIYYLARLYLQDGQRDKAVKLLSGTDKLYYTAICPISRQMMEALKAQAAC